jgi:hypothetical protein
LNGAPPKRYLFLAFGSYLLSKCLSSEIAKRQIKNTLFWLEAV